MKRFTLVGFLALMCLGSLAYADPFGCAVNPFSQGTPGAIDNNGTPDPNWYTYSLSTTTPALVPYCASVPANSSDPTAQRTSFLANAAANGQELLDTINWEVNPTVGPFACFPGATVYCSNPDLGDNEQGSGYPGNYPSPPYGGGVNGTGYTWGSAPTLSDDDNPLNLGLTNSFGTMPSFAGVNMLNGTTGNGDLALTWDTSTTDATYNVNDSNCQNPPSYGDDPSCWTPNPGGSTNAPISGLGFDIQLTGTGNSLGPWSVTFNVYGATPGCAVPPGEDTTVLVGGAGTLDDCFDYGNNQMTDSVGGDTSNDGGPTCSDDNELSCPLYNSSAAQLLGTITINSDSNGDPAFFGFTTTDPYGIGALVMTGSSSPSGESSPANFSIDEVTLLTQTPSPTPEPATLLLFGSGLLIAARRLRKRAAK